ncbi:MAG: anthranilate phosphoribosyltransferase [Acidimicrobiia bacterium]|nr:anthranilate phosphoribosyltransferase [Acidimicrobiia bacterium]
MNAVDEHGGWPALLGAICDGRDLGRDEAAAAMVDILSDSASPAQIAGLIVGLRIKGESVEEMTGLALAMLEAAEQLELPDRTVDIVGTGGSRHRRIHALNVSTMASIVAASAGATVCKHGNRRVSSTSGAFDFLETIGVGIELSAGEVERCVERIGIGFAFARSFHPAMRFAGPVRAELGIPTVFNILGPLAHPGRVTRQVVGTASEDLAARMAPVLKNLGSELSWVVTGDGGLDELSVTGPSVVFEVTADGIDRYEVTPEAVGLGVVADAVALSGGTPEQNAQIFADIIDGSETGARRDIVVLNAAAGLVVGGVAADLSEGVEAARAAIDDGRTTKKLDDLVAATT